MWEKFWLWFSLENAVTEGEIIENVLNFQLYWPNGKSEPEVSLVKEDLRIESANWEYRAGLVFSFVILDVCFTYSFFFPSYCKTACVLWSLAHVQHTLCFVAGISLAMEEDRDIFYFLLFSFELLQCVPSPSTLFGKALFFFLMLDSLVENMWEFFCFHLCCQFDFVLTVTYTGKGNAFSVNHDGLLFNSFISGDEK